MEGEFQAFAEVLSSTVGMLQRQAQNLLLPTRLYQIAILVACFVLAWGLKRVYAPKLYEWMRTREGWPKWRLRWMLTVQRRLHLIFFVGLAWGATWIMRAIHTFPSRSYLLALIATIATAWLLVASARGWSTTCSCAGS